MLTHFITLAALAFGISVGLPAKDTTCDLPQALKEEIQGYKPVVNQIIDAIVNGEFKGDTYKRFVIKGV